MQLEDISLAGVGESQRQWCSTGSCSCNPASACPKPWGETGRQNPLKRIPNFCRWQAGKPKKKGKYIVWAAEGITYFPFYLERKINWKKKTQNKITPPHLLRLGKKTCLRREIVEKASLNTCCFPSPISRLIVSFTTAGLDAGFSQAGRDRARSKRTWSLLCCPEDENTRAVYRGKPNSSAQMNSCANPCRLHVFHQPQPL